ncbi:hypothetical protein O0L34_g15268 [Tuta absoluta]|nr:hypothetical protein O0L34_g15268 [Tuta absoluta]
MFGSLLIFGVLATFAAAFQYETMYQKGVDVELPSPPEEFIIPSGQCTAILKHKEDYDCFGEVVALQVKVFDTGLYQASPKVHFTKGLNEVHIERQSWLCLGKARVELKFQCSYFKENSPGSARMDSFIDLEDLRSGMRKNTRVLRPGSANVDSESETIDSKELRSGTRKNTRVLRPGSVNVDDIEAIDSKELSSETGRNTCVLRPGTVNVDSDTEAIDLKERSGTRTNRRVLRPIPNTQ